jgi:hypothetical protein
VAKINIVCYAFGILFGSVALGIALTVAQEAWKANEHVKAISWSALVVRLAVAAAYVGALPMAVQADAERIALAAQRATKTDTEQGTVSSRPWITVLKSTIAIPRLPTDNYDPWIEVELINSGNAIAADVTAVYTLDIGPSIPEHKKPGPPGAPVTVGPQTSFSVIGRGRFAELKEMYKKQGFDFLSATLNGTLNYFMYGTIAYFDAARSKRYTTEFCFKFDMASDKLMLCDKWNSAD